MLSVYDSLAINLQIITKMREYDPTYVDHWGTLQTREIEKEKTEKSVYTPTIDRTRIRSNIRPFGGIRSRFFSRGRNEEDEEEVCLSNIVGKDDRGNVLYGKHKVIINNFTGEKVCSLCGIVIDDLNLDTGRDFRAYTHEDSAKKNHYGDPTNEFRIDGGLPTIIGDTSRDYTGKLLPAHKQNLHRRLKKWDDRSKTDSSKYNNFKNAMDILKRYSGQPFLNLPNIVQREVATLYKRLVLDNKDMKGREIEPTVLTLIYLVVQKHNMPMTPEQICKKVNYDLTSFNRARHRIIDILKLKSELPSPKHYINKICNDLNIDDTRVRIAATRIIEKTEYICKAKKITFYSGKNPFAIAAASIYISCKLTNTNRTQDQISKAVGITTVTLRNRYKDICQIIGIDPDDIRR